MKVLFTLFLAVLLIQPIAAQIDHGPYSELLKKHVSPQGNVNYQGFLKDQKVLDSYLTKLSEQKPSKNWSRNEKMSFWINAYNAFTIKAILNHYPIKSITHIKVPGAENIWKSKFFSIGGKPMSLDEIENGILRVEFDDPRIHFAINCASISCPILLNEAYTAERLNVQLTEQTKKFLKDSTKNQLSENQVKLSSIFDWFKSDFTKNVSLIDFINKYADVKVSKQASISFMEYDWNLNS